jgi:hypothetical protein
MLKRRMLRLYVVVVLLLYLRLGIVGRLLYLLFELFVGYWRLVVGLVREVGMGERLGQGRGPLDVSEAKGKADRPTRSASRLSRLSSRRRADQGSAVEGRLNGRAAGRLRERLEMMMKGSGHILSDRLDPPPTECG